MSDNNKSYRIRTNVGEDKVLNVNINQDFNVLEVLSLKISTDNLYKLHTSHYGCVTGRVLANGGFGIPNAKVSIFIAAEENDMEDAILSYLYPYKAVNSKNADKIRYNLLPEEQLSDCHRNVGTFPSKRTVLDDNNVLEIYDKYYKFTTRTNESGDYMIFGVPTGNQTLHVDIDLSDIGILSQRPRDMIYKGYNITQFENANMFKSGNDLDSLAQIFSQNQNVFVYPFWGEESEGDIAITRRDIEIQYEFVPTCVFMGSMITDEGSSGVSKRCIPSERMGKMDRLVTGNGTIEMIRKTPDGSVEEFIVQGNALINGDGVWCYQIPMNLDYVRTDEYGNIVRTDDITKGIPTRASVRFRFSLTEFENEGGTTHLSKVLVPNNPQYYTSNDRTKAKDSGAAILDYAFGSFTDDASFKDLFSNNVYSVKSFIPRFQMLNLDRNKRFSGIKAVNANGSNNPIPYNNIRVDLSFMFTLQCAVFKVLLWVVGVYNNFMSWLYQTDVDFGNNTGEAAVQALKNWIKKLLNTNGRCLYIGEGYCPEMDGWYFAPKCWENEIFKGTYQSIKAAGDSGDNDKAERIIDTQSIDTQNEDRTENGNRLCLTRKIDYFIQCVEINLAMEYDVIQFDFYNDWINGLIYVPRWMADVRPKRTFLFNTVRTDSKINACLEGGYSAIFSRRYAQQCALNYSQNPDGTFTKIESPKGCKNETYQKCHKSKGRKTVKILSSGGVVHQESASGNKYAYYFRPCEWLSGGKKCNLFATDIILLGSMEPNNTQGIPQTFEKLTPSTYQLPDTLASTNLGVDGALYGDGDANGTICNSYTSSSASLLSPTAENVKKWISTKDMNEPNPYDSAEENNIVTEASGIDWGYSGPGQDSNNLSKLYFPGGHFLGVSCFNSQTNIKSCVNLSRVCEAGAMLSQRQMMLSSKDSQSNDAKPYYFIPTGLISNREINDYGFRNEFATLNYNKLKTKTNPDTLLKEYDFETVFPINFNGELKGKIDDEEYNKAEYGSDERRLTIEENSVDYYRFRLGLPKGFKQSDAKKKYLFSNATQVSLPVFENSFYFYFGLKSGSTALDKFYKDFYAECPSMKKYEPEVAVDIIHDADFCYDNGKIKVKVKNIESPKITVDGVGSESDKVEVYFDGLKGGETYTITVEGENILAITKTITIPIILPDAFSALSYDVENYTAELFPLDDESEGVGKIIFRDTNGDLFSDTGVCAVSIYLNDADEKVGNKYYAKSFINDNVTPAAKFDVRRNIESEYATVGDIKTVSSIKDLEVTAWKGNAEYTITIWYCCGGEWICAACEQKVYSEEKPTYQCSNGHYAWREGGTKEYESDTIEITMPKGLDVVFDGYEYASYRYLIKPLIDKYSQQGASIIEKIRKAWFYALLMGENYDIIYPYKEWYNVIKNQRIFSGTDGKRRFNLAIYHLKRAILYRDTQAVLYGSNRAILFSIEGGKPPYDTSSTTGSGEMVSSGGSYSILNISNSAGTAEDMSNSGFTMNVSDFIAPTAGIYLSNGNPSELNLEVPSTLNYFYDYNRNGSKHWYKLYVKDRGDESILFYVPSMYRPFFNKALYVSLISDRVTYGQHYEHIVANPISSHNGDESKLTLYDTFTGSESKISAPDVDFGGVYVDSIAGLELGYNYVQVSGTTETSVITGGTYVASVKEEGEYGEYREAQLNAHFLGDGWQDYDMRVTYYPICETFAQLLYPERNVSPWQGATSMDRELGKDFISYFPRRHNLWCRYYPPLSERPVFPMMVFGKSESNGGILWSPFLSGMIHETYTKWIEDEDWTHGWISVTTANTNTRLSVSQPEVIGPSARQKTDSTYVTGEILRHHRAIPHEVLIAALGKEPGTAEYNALLNEFKFGSDGLEWGCLGVAESFYGYNNEFGTTKEDFRDYVANGGRTALYTFNQRHAPTISVLRVYSREAFLKLITNPGNPYYEVL